VIEAVSMGHRPTGTHFMGRATVSQGPVLNVYEPLNITSGARAHCDVLKGKARKGLEHDSSHFKSAVFVCCVPHGDPICGQFVRVPSSNFRSPVARLSARTAISCQYCGYQGDQLSIDHVIPRSRGGIDSWEKRHHS